jgi:hypothetical protein
MLAAEQSRDPTLRSPGSFRHVVGHKLYRGVGNLAVVSCWPVTACTATGYTDLYVRLQWLKQIFDLETKGRANNKLQMLICDSFSTHKTLEILKYCFANNIVLC